MDDAFLVFVVDDDEIILDILRTILESICKVETFDSVEACAPRLEAVKPQMFLLDVSLPGMNGYEFCRQIKDDPALSTIPVTFISSNDTIEARLQGYDAGGEDFIVKPFEPEEVLRKVRVAQQIVQNQRALAEQAEAAEQLSSLALASMDESGIVLQFMSKLIGWSDEEEIAAGLLELMQRYGLTGVVQTRVAQRALTLSAAGTNLPLETSVMDHVRGMGRIFEFGNRSVHNFERVTLMVSNMPVHDPEFCGRVRDNLSVAAQGADSRLSAIETEEANRRNRNVILEALGSVREAIDALQQGYDMDRLASSELMLELDQSLANSFVHLGLTTHQERCLEELVGEFMHRLAALMDRGEEAHDALRRLGERLAQLN